MYYSRSLNYTTYVFDCTKHSSSTGLKIGESCLFPQPPKSQPDSYPKTPDFSPFARQKPGEADLVATFPDGQFSGESLFPRARLTFLTIAWKIALRSSILSIPITARLKVLNTAYTRTLCAISTLTEPRKTKTPTHR